MSGDEQQVLEAPRPDETPKTWAEAIAAQPNPFAIAAARYVRAPIAFVREVLGAEPDPWQLEALRALAKGHTRIAIRSGHGVGKSCLAAWVIVWFQQHPGAVQMRDDRAIGTAALRRARAGDAQMVQPPAGGLA